MFNKILAIFVTVLLAAMLFACGVFSVGFIIAGGAVPVLLGIALACLCLLGWWALYQEVRFGVMAEKAGKSLACEEPSEKYYCSRTDHNSLDPVIAGDACDFWRARTEEDSGAYDNWYRLALACDRMGDRKGARGAMREAVRLYNRQSKVDANEKV